MTCLLKCLAEILLTGNMFIWQLHIYLNYIYIHEQDHATALILLKESILILLSILAFFSNCRNYLSSVLIQEIFLTLDHDDLSQRTKVGFIQFAKYDMFLFFSLKMC